MFTFFIIVYLECYYILLIVGQIILVSCLNKKLECDTNEVLKIMRDAEFVMNRFKPSI